MVDVAALFVDPRGAYAGDSSVDMWDEARDARKYAGPYPVVAHPPCSRWCQLAHINQKRYGHKVGDDGGCFASAIRSVERWGGVLEHPKRSYAWPEFELPPPAEGCWTGWGERGWVCEVWQSAYGHRAAKATWLYYVGRRQPLPLRWARPQGEALVSFCKNHGGRPLPRLSKREASATPPTFAAALLDLARWSRG